MKNFAIAFIFVLLGSFFFTACGPSKDDAIKYNDTLISLQELIVEKDDVFLNSQGNADSLKMAHTELLNQVNATIKATEKIGAFDDYNDFHKACLEFLGNYKGVVEKEYTILMSVVSKPDSLISLEDNELYDSAYDVSIDKIEMAAARLNTAQEEFAKKFNFKIAKKPLE